MKYYYKSLVIACISLFMLAFSFTTANAGCTLTASITSTTGSECWNSKFGSIIVTASGGAKPYTYSWSPSGGNSDTAKNLAPGAYTVTVTDSTGCIATAVGYIGKDSLWIPNINDTVCGLSSGTLNGNVMGGGPAYSFNWSTGATTTSITVPPGTYTFTAVDAIGCVASRAATLVTESNISGLTVTPTTTNTTCPYSQDGSIVLAATAATSPFTYEWKWGYGSNGIYNLYTGTYSVTIWDKNKNCNAFSYRVDSTYANCGILYGYTVNDTNFTCTYSASDPVINNSVITINPGGYTYTPDITGYYSSSYLPYGSYTITQSFPSGSPFAACMPAQPVTISSSASSVNFEDTTHSKLSDPAAMYLYNSFPVVGDSFSAYFQIKNIGRDTSFGRAFVTVPDSMTFISAIPAYSSYGNDTVFWNYSGLAPGDTLNYGLNCKISGNPSIYNMTFWINAGVIPFNPESNSQNDIQGDGYAFADAYDPNSKSVSPTGIGPTGIIQLTDSVLTYTVRFQNTGTAAAQNIYAADTISSKLDISTLNVLGASNTYSYQVVGNRVKFTFSSINLPDSGTTQKGSHGWIQYQIKQNKTNKPGDVIHNTAYIYFDFNAPVATNTTTNTINTITAIAKISNNNNVSVYPNPSNGVFNFELRAKSEELRMEIYNMLGEKLYSELPVLNSQFSINISNQPAGIYFYRLISNKGEFIGSGKLVIH